MFTLNGQTHLKEPLNTVGSLTTVQLLAYPDSNKPLFLYTDSSDTCIGACLTLECD